MAGEIPVVGYLSPGSYTFRNPLLGTAVLAGTLRIPAISGLTRGALTDVVSEAVTKGLIGATESLVNAAESVSVISNTSGGANAFLQGVDYLVTAGKIDWSPDTTILTPSGLTAVGQDVDGGLTGGAYSYVVVARKKTNLSGPVYGQTKPSQFASATVAGSASGQVNLSWNPVTGADDYQVFRLLGLIYNLLATVSATSYQDNGSVGVDITKHPPITNTAYKQPATGASYYVSYSYRALTFLDPRVFTSVTEAMRVHGPGSDLAVAAELILAPPPDGQGAPAVMLIAVSADTDEAHRAAFDKLKFQMPTYVVPLRSTQELNMSDTQHCVAMSSYRSRRERTGMLAPPAKLPDGSNTTDANIAAMAKALDFQDEFGAPSGRRVMFISEVNVNIHNVMQTNGTRIASKNFPAAFAAAGLAGLAASMADTATPMTNKILTNVFITSERDDAAKDILATAGVCVLHDTGNGLCTVRHALTAASIDAGRFVEDQESNIVFTDDLLAQNLRIGWNKFIGLKRTLSVLQGIKGSSIRTLGIMQKSELITSFDPKSIEVRPSTISPTFVLVFFLYIPIYGVNAVSGQYGFDVVTG
jgi:hypothetical protein